MKIWLRTSPLLIAASLGCGGNQPPQSSFGGGGADAMFANGSLGTGPARGNAAKKQPDLGIDSPLNGYKPFDDTSAWNKPVDKAPVDPASDKIIAKMGVDKVFTPGFGAADKDGKPFGIPYTVVSGDAPRVLITFEKDKASDPGPYPFPTTMPIEATAAAHAIVLDRDSEKLYETSGTTPNGAGFKATSGAIWDLRIDRARKPDQLSADASGLPVFPGLVRYDEVNTAKEIDHALRFTAAAVRNTFVAPATHTSGTAEDADLPPMGVHLRLKKSFDASKLPASTQVIVKALKKYGMILCATGPDWTLSGAPDIRWVDPDLATLKQLNGSNFEVVKMVVPKSTPKSTTTTTPTPSSAFVPVPAGAGAIPIPPPSSTASSSTTP